jgi:hypothetical protein
MGKKIYINKDLDEIINDDEVAESSSTEIEEDTFEEETEQDNAIQKTETDLSEGEKKIDKLNVKMKYPSPELFAKKCDEYFESLTRTKFDKELGEEITYYIKPLTINGLSNYLDFYDATSLIDYAQKDEYLPIIKKARGKIYAYVESLLLSGKNVTGAIFWLKCNASWKDGATPQINQAFIDKPLSLNYVTPSNKSIKNSKT